MRQSTATILRRSRSCGPLLLLLLSLLCLTTPQPVRAGSFDYPLLAPSGRDAQTFLPNGWRLLDSATGDLNGDGRADLAFVIENDTIVSEARGTGGGDLTMRSSPRILGIAFGGDEGYILSAQSHRVILRAVEGGTKGDPWAGLDITNGTLVVRFFGGSGWQWKLDYRFRYQDDDWYLVGATSIDFHTGSGDIEVDDYDFVSGDVSITNGKMDKAACRKCADCPECVGCAECEECGGRSNTQNIGPIELPRLGEFEPSTMELIPGKFI